MRLLIHPIMQLFQDVLRVVPKMNCSLLQFKIGHATNKIMRATRIFAPIPLNMLHCHHYDECFKRNSKKTESPFKKLPNYKVLSGVLTKKCLRDKLLEQALEVLSEYFRESAYHVAFPELSLVFLLRLRRVAQYCTQKRFREYAKQLMETIKYTAQYMRQRQPS